MTINGPAVFFIGQSFLLFLLTQANSATPFLSRTMLEKGSCYVRSYIVLIDWWEKARHGHTNPYRQAFAKTTEKIRGKTYRTERQRKSLLS
jgi:hypothetical protein